MPDRRQVILGSAASFVVAGAAVSAREKVKKFKISPHRIEQTFTLDGAVEVGRTYQNLLVTSILTIWPGGGREFAMTVTGRVWHNWAVGRNTGFQIFALDAAGNDLLPAIPFNFHGHKCNRWYSFDLTETPPRDVHDRIEGARIAFPKQSWSKFCSDPAS